MYKRFYRKYEDMDSYEKARLYAVGGIGILTVVLVIGLMTLFYLRYLNVVIGVDTAGLLGKPVVFVNNMSASTLKDVSIEMDNKYTATLDKIEPKQSVVIYFTSFKPLPPQGYKPLEIKVKSGFGVKTKSLPPVSK
jgi:hypothetical protein